MYRAITLLTMLSSFLILLSCSIKQEWSANYAQMDGVKSTSPQMVDGNLLTVGETASPTGFEAGQGDRGQGGRGFGGRGFGGGGSPPSEVVITLPEKKMIRRMVIHSDSLMTFNVYANKADISERPDWRIIKEVKSVKSNPIQVSISAGFPIDQIRLVVLRSIDDSSSGGQRGRSRGGRGGMGGFRPAAQINEIELFGYASASEGEVDEVTSSQEQDLNELLK